MVIIITVGPSIFQTGAPCMWEKDRNTNLTIQIAGTKSDGNLVGSYSLAMRKEKSARAKANGDIFDGRVSSEEPARASSC